MKKIFTAKNIVELVVAAAVTGATIFGVKKVKTKSLECKDNE